MREILHILRFKIRTYLSLTIDWKASTVVKHLGSILVFGGFAIGACYAAHAATDYLLGPARLGLFLLHRFLSMLLFVYFISINVGNIIVSYATLYRSSEVSYFFTKPVSHVSVFVVKFLENFFYSSGTFFLMAISVLVGYGSHFHMPWTFYLRTMLLMMIPFMLIAGCVGVITLMAFMRFAESLGLKRIIACLASLYLGIMYAYFAATNPMRLVAAVSQYYPHVDQYFGFLDPAFVRYLPNHWIAESLYWTMRGDPSLGLSYTLLLLLATAVIAAAMVAVAKRLYFDGWLASMRLQAGGGSRSVGTSLVSLDRAPRLRIQTSVLLKKEILQFIREPSQWIHMGVISLLILTFLASIATINLRQSLPFLQTISYTVVLLFNAFLIASIALRFVFPGISIEGTNFWKILSAPVSRSKVYWLKFALAAVPIFLASESLVLFSHRSLMDAPGLVAANAVIMAAVAFALIGLNQGAGSYFTDFRERNPIRVASSQSATLTFLASLSYLTLVVAIVFFPFNNFFSHLLRGAPLDRWALAGGVAAVVVLSGAFGAGALFAGLRALRRDY